MDGRRWLLIVLCVVVSTVQGDTPPTDERQIHLASEQWTDYTSADGSGLAWDVLRKVFEPAGITVQTHSVPYTRSIGLAQRAEVDAWVGAYHNEVEGLLYPRSPYDSDHIYALGLASNPSPTLETLGSYRLAWVRGYKYDQYLLNLHHFDQLQRRDGVLTMLLHGRVDFYIDALPELKELLSRAEQPKRFKLTHITELPLFLGFADNDRGRRLMALFDRRMVVLKKNGELKPVFARWNQPYPF